MRLSLIMGSLALLLHGGLAYYFNVAHGSGLATKAAIAQGVGCFVATLCSAWLMQFFFDFGKVNWQRCFYATFGAGSIMLSVIVGIHWFNQTPEIINTVGAAAIVAVPYYILFPLFLLKQHRAASREIKLWSFPYSLAEFLLVLKNNIFGPSARNKKMVINRQSPVCLADIDCKVRIGFIGDLMPLHGRDVTLDPRLLKYLSGLDYLVANFEGSLFPSKKKGLLAQAHKADILELLGQILPPEKIILSCANNHAADFGEDNFIKNNSHLEGLGYTVIGSESKPSVVLEEQIEIIAATEWSNQKASYMYELDDLATRCVSEKFQILYPHWCYELELYPNQVQVDRAEKFLGQFDLIVGHHAHSPGVVTLSEHGEDKKMVAYSLGDFTFAVGGPVCKYFAWGQVMVAEFGPKKGAAGNSPWKQGETHWAYTHIVTSPRGVGGKKGSQVVELSETCPWFA